jgi:ribosomal protein L11 methyltransferase
MGLQDQTWSELQVAVPPTAVSSVSAFFFGHGCLGITEEAGQAGEGLPPVVLKAYFEGGTGSAVGAELERRWAELAGGHTPDTQVSEIAYGNWAEAWKENFKPLAVGRRLVVAPTWEDVDETGRVVIRIDPGMAFGTGAHETTRLCLAEVERLLDARPGATVLDVGAGSAILSIAAARLGASRVLGTEIDPDAVPIAQENLQANGVQGVDILCADLSEVHDEFDLVVANILAPTLVMLAPLIAGCVVPGGTVVLSGILAPQASEVWAAYQAQGLTPSGEETLPPPSGLESDRWVMLRLTRPAARGDA